jgi:hypothetical protein
VSSTIWRTCWTVSIRYWTRHASNDTVTSWQLACDLNETCDLIKQVCDIYATSSKSTTKSSGKLTIPFNLRNSRKSLENFRSFLMWNKFYGRKEKRFHKNNTKHYYSVSCDQKLTDFRAFKNFI